MTTLTLAIVVAFVLGYTCIATESLTKVNKAAVALLMFVACWTLYMFDPLQYLTLMHPDYTGHSRNGREGDHHHTGAPRRHLDYAVLPYGCHDNR